MFICLSLSPPSSAATRSPWHGSTKPALADRQDFEISEATVHNWLKKANIEDGTRSGVTEKEAAELRDARKRIRLLEQENEILRRAAAFFARELPPK